MNVVCTKILAIAAVALLLASCGHTPQQNTSAEQEIWINEVINYQVNFDESHPDSPSSMLQLDPAIEQAVRERFGDMRLKHTAAKELALWLVAEDGHAMRYQLGTNLRPLDAYQQKLANCISFTLLLERLAQVLGIKIQFNQVDIPDEWGLNEDNGFIFYRHLNGVFRTHQQHVIFDLALQDYWFGYPQRIISRQQALALLYSNMAIDALNAEHLERAYHLIRLGVSSSPRNPDLWVNLGVIMKNQAQLEHAETAFLRAFSLSPDSHTAASNLERLYRLQSRESQARLYRRAAQKSRNKNPYYHFGLAQQRYASERYKSARKSIKKAIKLHDGDPLFYDLSSRIAVEFADYETALKSLEKAYLLSQSPADKKLYADKVKTIQDEAIALAKANAERIETERARLQRLEGLQF